VPYGEIAEVVERDPETGELSRYQEQFLKGSCARMAQGVHRRGNAAFIKLVLDHDDQSFDAWVGHAVDLRSEEDGAYASFRLYDGNDLPKVRSMLQESHTGLSINFGDIRPPKLIDGVISRVQVAIDHVAATPIPTYSGAGITSMRSADGTDMVGTPNLASVRAFLAELKGTSA
jgi:HK97 family phage prohead protease